MNSYGNSPPLSDTNYKTPEVICCPTLKLIYHLSVTLA